MIDVPNSEESGPEAEGDNKGDALSSGTSTIPSNNRNGEPNKATSAGGDDDFLTDRLSSSHGTNPHSTANAHSATANLHAATEDECRAGKLQRTRKAQATQSRILTEALHLFQTKGFDKTSIRDIAEAAGVAVGASYYYFRTKEELVLAYYEEASSQDEEFVLKKVSQTNSFVERFSDFMTFKVEQLKDYRSFVNVLARSAANPADPLSPFSQETKHIRERAILWMELMIAGSDLKVSAILKPYIPRVLWFYMMGVIFFWIHDRTDEQRATQAMISSSVKLVTQLFWLSTLPLTGKINASIVTLFRTILLSQESGPFHAAIADRDTE